ncbi:MAG: helix-turn-helix domain-containing protein [Planctomycetes bacterium]|nr:helix-turn-helix domain-containing protein [Planctomycetota bacterium]
MSPQDVQRDLARLAALHREQAEVFDRLAVNLADVLAVVAQPRLMEPVTDTSPEFLTAPELAARLRIDERTLRSLRHAGDVPAPVLVGTRPRWRRADVDAWLAERGAS